MSCVATLFVKNAKNRGAQGLFMSSCTRTHGCVSVSLFAFMCSWADKDLESALSVPGSQAPSILAVNGLHMDTANTGYGNIPVYSNMRADYFS